MRTRATQKFSLRQRIRSLGYAWQGILFFFRKEHNAVIHLIATLSVIFLAYIFEVSATEAIALTGVTGFVWAAELFNTAIEKTMDLITDKKHSSVKFIKDVAAAAVLVAAMTALLTGAFVFVPKIISLWQS